MDLADVPTTDLKGAVAALTPSTLRDLIAAEFAKREASIELDLVAEARLRLVAKGPEPGYAEPVQFRPGSDFGAVLGAVSAVNGQGRNVTARTLSVCGLYGIDYGLHGVLFDRLIGRGPCHDLARAIRGVPAEEWEAAAERLASVDAEDDDA